MSCTVLVCLQQISSATLAPGLLLNSEHRFTARFKNHAGVLAFILDWEDFGKLIRSEDQRTRAKEREPKPSLLTTRTVGRRTQEQRNCTKPNQFKQSNHSTAHHTRGGSECVDAGMQAYHTTQCCTKRQMCARQGAREGACRQRHRGACCALGWAGRVGLVGQQHAVLQASVKGPSTPKLWQHRAACGVQQAWVRCCSTLQHDRQSYEHMYAGRVFQRGIETDDSRAATTTPQPQNNSLLQAQLVGAVCTGATQVPRVEICWLLRFARVCHPDTMQAVGEASPPVVCLRVGGQQG